MVVVMCFIMILLVGIVLLATSGDSENRFGIGLVLTFASSFGFLISSFEKDITSEWVPREVFYVKTPRLVVVDDGTNIWQIKDYKDVVSVNDSTVFLFEETTNLWGTVLYEDIKQQNK